MEPMETIERDGCVGEIHYDECPNNPREDYDHDGTLIVQLSNNYLAPSKADAQDWRYDALREAWNRGMSWRPNGSVIYGDKLVERYARVFLGAAAVAWWDDPTSSARLLCIVDADSGFTDPQSAAESTLAEYVAYCVGDVYGYTVETEDGEQLDACWGYFGDVELPYLRECINDAIDAHRDKVHAERTALYRRLVGAA